ncbi:hypothetical protein DERP_000106 [Dermatophagoides pteronyssinus]|uniref:Uncharacterized protein n=1 Tax=Dermatophagoides pteronyssinus TaxID=6956 RepID=A0ABQ8IZ74_DERPT|nr:hypothetical protein DERP_000106 [Dermatophagoides pteronyssinus]
MTSMIGKQAGCNCRVARSKVNSESIEQYLEYFGCIIEMNGWNDEQAANGFRAALVPNTQLWKSVLVIPMADRKSFAKIAEALRVSTRQLEELYPDAPDKTKRSLIRDRFYEALGPDLIAAIGSSTNFKTLEELKIQALLMEDALSEKAKSSSSNNKNQKNGKSKYCDHCCKAGHDTEKCRLKSRKKSFGLPDESPHRITSIFALQ